MKTAEIKPDQTYQGAFRYKSTIFEVIEIATPLEREWALKEEGLNYRRIEAEKRLTIHVREIGFHWPESRSAGVRLHPTAEEKKTYWVRPQDISHEIDVDDVVQKIRERAEAREARRQQVRKEKPKAVARVGRVNAHLSAKGIPVFYRVVAGETSERIEYDNVGEFTIDHIEKLLGIHEE